jgi:Holliday junction resolvase
VSDREFDPYSVIDEQSRKYLSHGQIVSDADIVKWYEQTGNIWVTAEILGLCGQSVHERLVRLGLNKKINKFTEEETKRLISEYALYKDQGKLDVLAASMGRTKSFICTKARKLGLTSYNHPRPYISTWKYMSPEIATSIWEEFKSSRLGVRAWCSKKGMDDLGFSVKMKKLFPDEYDDVVTSKAPKSSWRARGSYLEYKVRDHLISLGYAATRSPASKGPADVTAFRPGEVVFVQCKRNLCMGVEEWNRFIDYCRKSGATPILAGMPTGRGIIYKELTGKKDGSRSRQPYKLWSPTVRQMDSSSSEDGSPQSG